MFDWVLSMPLNPIHIKNVWKGLQIDKYMPS